MTVLTETEDIAAHLLHGVAVFRDIVRVAIFNQIFIVKASARDHLIMDVGGGDVIGPAFKVDPVKGQHAL